MKIGIANASRMAIDAIEWALQELVGVQIMWIAEDGETAVAKAVEDRVDLILMEILLPGIGGIEATQRILKESPTAILIVTSNVEKKMHYVSESMGWGALDVAETPLGPGQTGQEQATGLAKKVSAIGKMLGMDTNHPTVGESSHTPDAISSLDTRFPLIVFGASTGGPGALVKVLAKVHGEFNGAIVVIQHMEPRFAVRFAKWLDFQMQIEVKPAESGETVAPGKIYVAAERDHLVLTNVGTLQYIENTDNRPYRPSVDVFFESVARFWSQPGVAIVLTGMGDDGAVGLKKLKRRGWHTIAQDEASSAIYGMPKVAKDKGAAMDIWSLDRIALFIQKHTGRRNYTAK